MTAVTISTITVSTFNMAQWLNKNLTTYCDERLFDRLEVLYLNNTSEDSSRQVMESYVPRYLRIFRLTNRDSRGYGSPINQTLAQAQGRYFRIVDADDWVNTSTLIDFSDALEGCETGVVLTDYQIVNIQNGEMMPIRALQQDVAYNVVTESFSSPLETLPSIHNTSYRTGLFHSSGFYM